MAQSSEHERALMARIGWLYYHQGLTQQDIADLLGAQGYTLRPRDVRLGQTIKRVGSYEVHIKFDADLEAVVKLVVQPDRKLDLDEEEESETPEEQAEAPAAGGEAAASDDKAKADKKN